MRSESDSAVSKLANESAAERMAGVNSLVALADDWGSDSDLQSHEYHQKNMCICTPYIPKNKTDDEECLINDG
ncbi:hypothetical protein MCC10017_1858 [Bifidobacterium longum subsp. longum]|nr:hypothetical protein MCC10017_1858 [Bifidobacterium longum subsp. longum]